MQRLSTEEQIVISLRRISRAIDVWSRRMLNDYGITSPQAATLRQVMGGVASPGVLATALHLSQPTMSGILSRLEQRGLVVRERSTDDRRSVFVRITDEGRELASKAPPLLRDGFCQELRQLPIDQQRQILDTLASVGNMMHAPQVSEVPYFFIEQSFSTDR